MRNIGIVLICLSVLSFILAVIRVFVAPIPWVSAEGFSHGCTNLALIAIALTVCCKYGEGGKGSSE